MPEPSFPQAKGLVLFVYVASSGNTPTSKAPIVSFLLCRALNPRPWESENSGFHKFLFVIRNAKHSAENLTLRSLTMPSTMRGERSGSGRLPELRR
jgi:hypothetical protein